VGAFFNELAMFTLRILLQLNTPASRKRHPLAKPQSATKTTHPFLMRPVYCAFFATAFLSTLCLTQNLKQGCCIQNAELLYWAVFRQKRIR
jgi:hypothetical protein